MQPIETRYDGCHFRSRTEARWAVFFNALGLHYEYEKEGYALPSGWYLPDFWLPEIGYWFEVKGQQPTTDELIKCAHLFDALNRPVLMAIGSPAAKPQLLHIPILMNDEECERGSCSLDPRLYFGSDRINPKVFCLLGMGSPARIGIGLCSVDRAYERARSARFERR